MTVWLSIAMRHVQLGELRVLRVTHEALAASGADEHVRRRYLVPRAAGRELGEGDRVAL